MQRLILFTLLILFTTAYPVEHSVSDSNVRQTKSIELMNWQLTDRLYRQLHSEQNHRHRTVDLRTKSYEYPSELRPVEGPINIEQLLAMLAARNVKRYPYSRHNDPAVIDEFSGLFKIINVMSETTDDNKIELVPPPITNLVEDSIASRTKEITKRPKRERSPPVQIQLPAPKVKKAKEVAPKLPDKTKWSLEEQKQFFGALRIYGKNFEALGQFFNTRRRNVNPEAQKRTFGQIRCFYYRSFRTVSKLCTFTEEEKANVDSLELRSVLAYLCLKPKVKYFDKKPTITVLHQLIRNGSAFLRVKGQREHVSIIGKALKPPKTASALGSSKQTDRTLSKHVKILLSPVSSNAYMRVALSCRYPHVEVLLSRSATLHELIDKLTQYWQLHNHAQCLFKDELSSEQLVLYPHGSYLTSMESTVNNNESARSRSDSEQSSEPLTDTSSSGIRKRNNVSETDGSNDSATISPPAASNKPNLARTAMLSAAKRAICNTNNYDSSGFTLVDGVEDEADTSAGLFKQRLETIDFTDEGASEDEIEPDSNTATSLPASAPSTSTSHPTTGLSDLIQGITRSNSLFSNLTIGELQKLLQRPKELRLLYDFLPLSRANTTDSPNAFLHYVIQIANQCLTSLAERQAQTEMKTAKKINTKKQQTVRSKCYCSCCAHHQLSNKDQRRPSTKMTSSPNTDLCSLLQIPQATTSQESSNEDILTVQTSFNKNLNLTSDGELHKQTPMSRIDEQSDIFDSLPWPTDVTATITSLEQSQVPASTHPSITKSSNGTAPTTELPPLLTLLLPMTNGPEAVSTAPAVLLPPAPSQSKSSAIIFSSNNGVIDDPLIQSLAAEQAASANKYDLLSYRYKRVRRPLRYGDQSTRPSNTQLLLDANINAQQTATAANQRLTFNNLNISTTSNNPFRSDCENPNDLLNDNSNLSSVSLSTTIVNAALQSNTSRLRLDWPDNMSDLSFGSFPDLLESNLSSGELTNFEQSTPIEQNKCASENTMSDALFAINNTTNLLLQN
ncbi:unnamed protein product [Adineta ricciae]|uniref:SANT domain-containing protein n=2 Tax=Adineta ricciae TaxID=249248 RepID=A0A814UGQ4_ADIRI|nr:unnamed protein product [Adineta ricciae]